MSPPLERAVPWDRLQKRWALVLAFPFIAAIAPWVRGAPPAMTVDPKALGLWLLVPLALALAPALMLRLLVSTRGEARGVITASAAWLVLDVIGVMVLTRPAATASLEPLIADAALALVIGLLHRPTAATCNRYLKLARLEPLPPDA